MRPSRQSRYDERNPSPSGGVIQFFRHPNAAWVNGVVMALVKFEVLVTRNEGTEQQENDVYAAYFHMAFLPRKDEKINVGDSLEFEVDEVEHALNPNGEGESILKTYMPQKHWERHDQLMRIFGFVKQ